MKGYYGLDKKYCLLYESALLIVKVLNLFQEKRVV